MLKEKKTFWSFVWTLWNAYKENNDMRRVINAYHYGNCEKPLILPSREFRIKNNISSQSENLHVWGVLEKYVNGDLIDKNERMVIIEDLQELNGVVTGKYKNPEKWQTL